MIDQAVILAAGRGSRLQTLVEDRTKATLPVLGKPLMVRVMERILEAGIKRFVVVIGEQDGSLASYLSHSWYPHTEVKYVVQPSPTGAADALALAARYIKGDFLLSAADSIPPPEHIPALLSRFETTGADFVISLVPATSPEIALAAEATLEGDQVTGMVEKPENPVGAYAAFMLYAASLRFLSYLSKVSFSKRGEKELVSAVQALIVDGGKVTYVSTALRHHFNADSDLFEINRAYLEQGRDCHILSELPGSVTIIPPVRIDPGVIVGRRARVGPYVYLESGCSVGEGATVAEAVVLRNATVAKGDVCEQQIVTRTTRIPVRH
jgi:NDP-sugar pyrophosphorylase family protein